MVTLKVGDFTHDMRCGDDAEAIADEFRGKAGWDKDQLWLIEVTPNPDGLEVWELCKCTQGDIDKLDAKHKKNYPFLHNNT